MKHGVFKGNILFKEGTTPILSGSYLEKHTLGQDELIISTMINAIIFLILGMSLLI
jgi:hypothetical protein